MGKHRWRKNSSVPFENRRIGCMWSMFHMLDYKQWNQAAKKLPHRRHDSERHTVGAGIAGNDVNASNADCIGDDLNAKKGTSFIEEKMKHSNPATKALSSEEKSKKMGRQNRSSTCPVTGPVQSQLMRTLSIHHLQLSDRDPLAKIIIDDEISVPVHLNSENSFTASTMNLLHPQVHNRTMNHSESTHDDEHGKQLIENHTVLQEEFGKTKQELWEQSLAYAKEFGGDVSLYQSKEFMDALDIISMNKDVFLKILQDPDSSLAHHFHDQHASNKNIGLKKYGSFTAAGSSGINCSGPHKLQQEQEVESHSKGEGISLGSSRADNLVEVTSVENIHEESTPFIAECNAYNTSKLSQTVHEAVDGSPSVSPHLMKKRSQNPGAVKRFRDLRKKIKHAIREERKERHRISLDAVFHKIPYGRSFSKDKHLKEPPIYGDVRLSPGSSYYSGLSAPAACKDGVLPMRRVSSLVESLDKYSQLFESSFNRDSKYHISEQPKLRTDEGNSSGWSASKLLGRILSLPDLKSKYSLRSAGSCDSFCSETPIESIVDSTASMESEHNEQKCQGTHVGSGNNMQSNVDHEHVESVVEANDVGPVVVDETGSALVTNDAANVKVDQIIDDCCQLIADGSGFLHDQEVGSTEVPTIKLTEPCSVSALDDGFLEVGTNTASEVPIPDDFSSSPQSLHTSDDNGSFIDLGSEEADTVFKSDHLIFDGLDSSANHQCESCMDFITMPESGITLENESNYVREVLELSGFSKKKILGTWHSSGQPVDPSVFELVKDCLLAGSNSSEHEESGSCDRMLLFDLINEVLIGIYEKSFSYWPMPLSSLSHIRPMPVGYQVLSEVWANVSHYLGLRAELDQSLDFAVSQDLAKGDGWMNLQFDSECVGLEVEDMIFDDILDEVFLA